MEENTRDIQNIQNIQNNNSEFLPLKKAAEIFGYTEHHFGLLCRQGKLKNKRVGKKWFTTKEWVDEYFENFKNNTPVNNSEFISLKEASHISNYTQHHLGLLCRQGKLVNKREGGPSVGRYIFTGL